MLFGKDVDFALPVQALLERELPVEQLLEVSGIGEAVLDGLRDQIVLEDITK